MCQLISGVDRWVDPNSGPQGDQGLPGADGTFPDGTQAGEMNYWDGSNWVSVDPGSRGQTLTFCNGVPTWGPCPPLAIGDSYAGGIIFYLDASGEHGKVAANVDQGTSTWDNAPSLIANSSNYDAAGQAYNGWYFPSKDELNLMWENLHRFGCPKNPDPCPTALGNFENLGNYWSSTEFSSAFGWAQTFGPGIPGGVPKGGTNRVRAVRAF